MHEIPEEEWELWELYERHGEFSIWRKKSTRKAYYDVATAASITSVSRAILLDAIHSSKDVLYCDTDSLICGEFNGRIDDSALGAWKVEATCDRIAIAGKKLYAAYLGDKCVKDAAKGVRVSPDQIVRLCMGHEIEWRNDAPSFSIGKSNHDFLKRVLRPIAARR